MRQLLSLIIALNAASAHAVEVVSIAKPSAQPAAKSTLRFSRAANGNMTVQWDGTLGWWEIRPDGTIRLGGEFGDTWVDVDDYFGAVDAAEIRRRLSGRLIAQTPVAPVPAKAAPQPAASKARCPGGVCGTPMKRAIFFRFFGR